MFGQQDQVRNPEQLVFHPQTSAEYNVPGHMGGHQFVSTLGVRPVYRNFTCGACGSKTDGRVLCDVKRSTDGAIVQWCMCACDKKEPSIIIEKDGTDLMQLPLSRQFHPDPSWPPELTMLYEEAAKSYSAGAFTAASIVCRKLLMSCVCHEQARTGAAVKEGESFVYYVDYLSQNILNFPQAKTPLDAIRKIGNDAVHHVAFITQPEAERSLRIVGYLMNTLYALPVA